MNILLITYAYWPSLNPRAFRWGAIAEYWASQGHHVDVVCEEVPGRAAFEIVKGVNIHRIGFARGLARVIGAARGIRSTAQALPGQARPPVLRSAARKLMRAVWRGLYWPDYAFAWQRPATRKVMAMLSERHYDVMFSSSLPFTGHLVGLAAKKRFPSLPWVVDIGDPFYFLDDTPANNAALYRRLNYRAEGRVLAYADALSVTTAGTCHRYKALFPFAAAKFTVIPPLLLPSFTIAGQSETVSPRDKIRLVYVGTLYRRIRNPEAVLACFSKLLETDAADRVELHFFGELGDCRACFAPFEALVGTKIFLHGLVSREKVAEAMNDAAILINIGNGTAYQLPSKLIEYAAMAKPILNFVQLAEDSSAEFLAGIDGVVSISERDLRSDATAHDKILAFINHPPRIDPAERQRKLQSFRVEQISKTYLELARPAKTCDQPDTVSEHLYGAK